MNKKQLEQKVAELTLENYKLTETANAWREMYLAITVNATKEINSLRKDVERLDPCSYGAHFFQGKSGVPGCSCD